MNQKTKLIVGLACCAFLAIGIAQTPKATNESSGSIYVTNWDDIYLNTNALPRYVIAANHGPYTNCTWTVSDDTPTLTMSISTNNSVNWITIEQVPQTDVVMAKQVGTVQTNRILTVIHDGATNLVLLKVLGKEEWPSQTRVVQGRRQ